MPSLVKKNDVNFSAVAIVAVAAYIAAQMLADITSNKIGTLFGLAVDMGTFIYPITFTLRDLIHKQLGKKNARRVIVTAGVINILMAAYMYFTAFYPSHESWQQFHETFVQIFALTPRIVIASIIAEIASELLDTEIYHWFVTRVTSRHQWARVLVSNSISVPVDTAIFSIIAFAFEMPWPAVLGIFITNLIVKYAVTLISIPLIYAVPGNRNGEDMGEKNPLPPEKTRRGKNLRARPAAALKKNVGKSGNKKQKRKGS